MPRTFTEGSIANKLFLFALPILLSNFLQASILLINALWVGNLLGSAAFAAITVGTMVMVVILAFVFGINNATLTIFAQLKGADNKTEIRNYLSTFTIILILLSVLIGAVGYFLSEPLLVLLNTPEAILAPATAYLKINFVGTLFLVGYNFIGTILRAFGDSKTPLYFVLLAAILTAVLDPLFIAVFNLGVAGSAYATVLAQGSAFVYSLFFLARRHGHQSFGLKKPKWVEIKTIMNLGIPSGMQMIVIYAGLTVILSVVNTFGDAVVSGFGVAQRLDNLVLLPAIALGTAVNAMAAQNIGVQNWARVAQISRVGILYNLSIMSLLSAMLYVLAEPLVKLFITDEDSLNFGVSYLKTIALFYPFIGLNFIFNGVVRSSGAMLQVLVLNIISLWILRVPLVYWMTSLFGESGIALGIGISFFSSCLFSMAYYYYGGWRNKRLFE